MRVIFCADPLQGSKPDPVYQAEVAAVEALELSHSLISYEALVYDNDPLKAVRRVTPPSDFSDSGLYRGWMLTPDQYRQLYEALADRGLRLINDPAAYQHCHYLPESYPIIETYTPRSVWIRIIEGAPVDELMELLRPFGTGPVVVKDFVKSRKHEWEEACYIPSASDRATVERVVSRFLELQGEDLNEGLVFREFVPFEPLAKHSKSGMPLTKEFRLFFLDGEPIWWTKYWEEGDYAGAMPAIDCFREVAQTVRSRFFTMDIAQRTDGKWMIVELGDAQVAGLPEEADVAGFYRALMQNWPASGSALQ